MKIKGKTVLVTGANRGLGLAFAEAFLKAGAKKVYAAARDPKKVTLKGVVPVKIDVTNAEDIETAAQKLVDVDILVNNAGIFRQTMLVSDNVVDAMNESLATNFFAILAMSKAFAPVLAKNGGGAIANMLSVLSWISVPGTLAYSASKAAALSLTNGIRAELKAQGTQVVAIHAGYIDTDMAEGVLAPKVTPEFVAESVVKAIEADKEEVLADDTSRNVKSGLSSPLPLFVSP